MSRVNNSYKQWSIEAELRANIAAMRAQNIDLEEENQALKAAYAELKADHQELEAHHRHAIWERDQALLRVEQLEAGR